MEEAEEAEAAKDMWERLVEGGNSGGMYEIDLVPEKLSSTAFRFDTTEIIQSINPIRLPKLIA